MSIPALSASWYGTEARSLLKSTKAAREVVDNSERLKDPAMVKLAEKWKRIFDDQMGMMMKRIEKVIKEEKK